MRVTKIQAAAMLTAHDNSQFFSVKFAKKNGEIREMTCRKGVKSALRGGELGYNPAEKGLVSVYDVQAGGYRMINLEEVKSFRINRTEYVVGE